MRTSHWGCPVVCGLALLAVSGCYSSSPYSPYGPYGPPTYYSTPPAYMQPGAPYAPGGVQPSFPSPTPADPGGQWQEPFPADQGFHSNTPTYPPSSPTYTPNNGNLPTYPPSSGGTPTYIPPSGGRPTSNPGGSGSGSGSNSDDAFNSGNSFEEDGLVPMYEEPRPTRTRPTMPATPPNESFDGGAPPFSSGVDGGSEFKSAGRRPASGGIEQFEAPVAAQRVTLTSGTAPTTARKTVTDPSPYRYDKEHYRWLRGVVDFDAQDQAWNIIYSLEPDESDPYGGSLTLAADALLSGMQSGDCVLVQGEVDTATTDESGKPVYRVEHLARIVPEE